jgi:Predicted phosphatases
MKFCFFSFYYWILIQVISLGNAFQLLSISTTFHTRRTLAALHPDKNDCDFVQKNMHFWHASSSPELLHLSKTQGRIRNVLSCKRTDNDAYPTPNVNEDISVKDDYYYSGEEVILSQRPVPPLSRDIVGVIFDMDGTLIQPCIDFADMRNRIYNIADSDPALQSCPIEARRGDVLELYNSFSDMGKVKAKAVFEDIETKAIQDMTLMEHVKELCHFLDERGIQRAVLTRNVQRSVDAMHKMLWESHAVKEFYPAVSRETTTTTTTFLDAADQSKGKQQHQQQQQQQQRPLPSKPSPEPIYHICNIWGCSPEQVIMVGDSAADDIVAAYRANCGGRVLLMYNGKQLDNDAGGGNAVTEQEQKEREPSLVIENLAQLMEFFQQ